jgi:hypothetical protein
VIFAELKKFVDANLGGDAWRTLLKEAGLPGRMYLPCRRTRTRSCSRSWHRLPPHRTPSRGPAQGVRRVHRGGSAEDVPRLPEAEWKTLDVIEHTEGQVHTRVRVNEVGAKPPYLQAMRVAPNEVMLHYNSERGCARSPRASRSGWRSTSARTRLGHAAALHEDGFDKCEIRVVVN